MRYKPITITCSTILHQPVLSRSSAELRLFYILFSFWEHKVPPWRVQQQYIQCFLDMLSKIYTKTAALLVKFTLKVPIPLQLWNTQGHNRPPPSGLRPWTSVPPRDLRQSGLLQLSLSSTHRGTRLSEVGSKTQVWHFFWRLPCPCPCPCYSGTSASAGIEIGCGTTAYCPPPTPISPMFIYVWLYLDHKVQANETNKLVYLALAGSSTRLTLRQPY